MWAAGPRQWRTLADPPAPVLQGIGAERSKAIQKTFGPGALPARKRTSADSSLWGFASSLGPGLPDPAATTRLPKAGSQCARCLATLATAPADAGGFLFLP